MLLAGVERPAMRNALLVREQLGPAASASVSAAGAGAEVGGASGVQHIPLLHCAAAQCEAQKRAGASPTTSTVRRCS